MHTEYQPNGVEPHVEAHDPAEVGGVGTWSDVGGQPLDVRISQGGAARICGVVFPPGQQMWVWTQAHCVAPPLSVRAGAIGLSVAQRAAWMLGECTSIVWISIT